MKDNRRSKSRFCYNSTGGRPLFRYLLIKHNSEFSKILENLNLTTDELLHGNRILTFEEQSAIFGLACQLRAQDTAIGFNAAKLHDIHDSGLPGILARCCGKLREVVDVHEKYLVKLDSDGVLSRAELSSTQLSYVFDKLAYAPLAMQEYALSTTCIALNSLSSELRTRMIAFEFPGSAAVHNFSSQDAADIEKYFNLKLLFSTGRLALTLTPDALDVLIPTVDLSLKRLIEKKMRIVIGDLLPEDADELRNQVFTALMELYEIDTPVTLDAVANHMGFKCDTLKNALHSFGISFQKMKKTVCVE